MTHALTIISWQENLPEDEMPPVWMWSLDEELEGWFDAVLEARRERREGYQPSEVTPMTQNELTRARR